MQFLKSRFAILITLLLVVQAIGAFAIEKRCENLPAAPPLSVFPAVFNSWRMIHDYPLEDEVQKVLKATDYLNRDYVDGNGVANLYVAYFKSQRSGVAPHSPKNCLPGNGWVQESNEITHVSVAGFPDIELNRYVVQKGDTKNVVLYWYQSRQRTVASEYTAKLYVIADAMKLNRTDTSLVRVIAPVFNGDIARASEVAVHFTKDVYPQLVKQLPQ